MMKTIKKTFLLSKKEQSYCEVRFFNEFDLKGHRVQQFTQ